MNREAQEIFDFIAKKTFSSLSDFDWKEANAVAKIITRYSEVEGDYKTDVAGKSFSYEVDDDVIASFKTLRDVMAKANDNEAWYTATIHITSDGEFKFSFDYDNFPDFEYKPSDDKIKEELEKYPRKQ
ncbi:Protein of unknown function, DUF600 [Andreprevotia lacus DSM 23236]|jgi:hypothetical protein|uniref:Uncharacterized protein n=1 Tax=Andreprevotia lacus DSM 23236 TaxID=1121001 RepID=A0A1W1Y2R5_9NEIS|nr:immunity protein YezG family protein [Andreprevotia lacus]SMC30018.1 Protein of unknown function, DUF600 [Andreprevotia lacus DSM 23236]